MRPLCLRDISRFRLPRAGLFALLIIAVAQGPILKAGAREKRSAVNVTRDPAKAPVITGEPQDALVDPGATAVFTVKATGENLRYQWFINDKTYPGQTKDTLTVPNVQVINTGSIFHVEVKNRHGQVLSRKATLTVRLEEPAITSFDVNPKKIKLGEKVTFFAVYTNGTGTVRVGMGKGSGNGKPKELDVPSGQPVDYVPERGGTRRFRLKVVSTSGLEKTSENVTVEVVDPNKPDTVGGLLANRSQHTATLLPTGNVLIVGGQNNVEEVDYPTLNGSDRGPLRSVELYDPSAKTSKKFENIEQARIAHTTTLLKNGNALISGGVVRGDVFTNSLELYDCVGGKVIAPGAMNRERAYHTATLLNDGSVLFIGGSNSTVLPAEVYTPETGGIVEVGKTRYAYCHHTATLLQDGKVLITGNKNHNSKALEHAELYDPATKAFTRLKDMTAARFDHTATLLNNGKVLITGGSTGKEDLASAEIYDPVAGTFTAIPGGMKFKRSNHTATLMADGKVLIVGTVAETEIYDPQRNTFTTGNNVVIRSFHTATLLKDSRVMLAGGQGQGNLLDTVEFYGTSAGQPEDPGTPDDDTESAPVITKQPLSQTVSVGESATFTVAAKGGKLNYRWYKNNRPIANSNFNSYTLTNATTDDNGAKFSVRVSNSISEELSEDAILNVVSDVNKPVITSFTATPSTIKAGQRVQLLAVYSNGEGVIMPTGTPVSSGVPHVVVPSTDITYTLIVTHSSGAKVSASVTVKIGTPTVPGTPTPTVPAAGVYTNSGQMKVQRLGHTATLLGNGKVLITGGSKGNEANNILNSAELYDLSKGAFVSTGSMSIARKSHVATMLKDGRILVTGGVSNAPETLDTAEIFDPAKGTFAKTGKMNSKRADHTATCLTDGSVLVVGGGEGAELFNPKTGVFAKIANPLTNRSHHTACIFSNGKVLITGGVDPSKRVLATGELYDPATKQFTPTGVMMSGRKGHCVTVLNNGLVLLAGGVNETGDSLASAEIFDPANNSFRVTGGMACQRAEAVSTLLQNGHVLVTGFGDYTEIFNPNTAAFYFAGKLNSPRSQHSSTLLHDGSVLLAGGVSQTTILNTTERFKLSE